MEGDDGIKVVKRSFIRISRKPVESVVLLVLIFLIATVISFAVSISQAVVMWWG
jgi:hypothetical protein